ncbi:uncharacterized protein LOC129580968 [Paramacrobiotus metropolitanus]|uniref:uncharacterized protein LOC129580968 n=1 Tax=Paramacrobiotus metropolitanus TaxID=2943436 RepID=UPI0024460D15|nr:uncharacterized protein LOC129580968 [Paramacrobiotus metropolitanus]
MSGYVVLVLCGLFASGYGQFSETRQVEEPFNGIAVDGPFAINVDIGDKDSIVLSGSNKDFIKAVETVVENGTLKIRFNNWDTKFTGILQIAVTTKSIINLVAAGPAQITSRSNMKGQVFRIVVSGSAQVIANIEASTVVVVVSQSASMIGSVTSKNINAVLANSGTITLSGTTDNANVVVSGSGVFHGFGLNAATISTTANGSGQAEVNASQEIKASATDDAVVRTQGTSNVSKDEQDRGTVQSA